MDHAARQPLQLPRLALWNEGGSNGFRKQPIDFTNIPRSDTRHFRGIMIEGSRSYGRFRATPELLPIYDSSKHCYPFDLISDAILVHCKPLNHLDNREGTLDEKLGDENRYPDMPDRLDIYLLLKHRLSSIAFTGPAVAAKISLGGCTLPTIERLAEFEASRKGQQRYNRIKYRLQSLGLQPQHHEIMRSYASTALRAVGLEWPDKPRVRHRQWPASLERIGLAVETSPASANRYSY